MFSSSALGLLLAGSEGISRDKELFYLKNKQTFFTFYNCIVPMGFLPWEIQVVFPGESQQRQSRAT